MIAERLKKEVLKKFKEESKIIFRQMYSLRETPHKGKPVGQVGGVLIKELKYKSFRFYFMVDKNNLRILDKDHLINLLIRFVRMSDKKSQQKVINEIKNILIKFGEEGF